MTGRPRFKFSLITIVVAVNVAGVLVWANVRGRPNGTDTRLVDFEVREGDNYYTISVQFSTDFSNLSYVYVVSNLMKEEQLTLEELSQNDQ